MISGPMPSPRATVMGTASATCPPFPESLVGIGPRAGECGTLSSTADALRSSRSRRARARRAPREGPRITVVTGAGVSAASRDPDLPRPGRPLEDSRPEELATRRGLRPGPAARLGVVRVAPRARGEGPSQPGPRGARGLEPALPGLPSRDAERRRPARARGDAERDALPRLALDARVPAARARGAPDAGAEDGRPRASSRRAARTAAASRAPASSGSARRSRPGRCARPPRRSTATSSSPSGPRRSSIPRRACSTRQAPAAPSPSRSTRTPRRRRAASTWSSRARPRRFSTASSGSFSRRLTLGSRRMPRATLPGRE